MSQTLKKLVPTAGWDIPVQGLHYDSRKITAGFLFFAVPGTREDGAKYLSAAFGNGAVAAVVQKGANVPSGLREKCLEVENVRRALAEASAAFHGYPARKLRLFGITGTKGKTSSVYILEAIFTAAGQRTALLGTVECRHPGRRMESSHTTLDSLELQAFLAEALTHGTEVVLMEISSHALSMDRIWGLQFEGLLFTNLSEDHLDHYGNMENYYQAKKLLFLPPYRQATTIGAANKDDAYGARLLRECPGRWLSFGQQQINNCDLLITEANLSAKGSDFTLEGPGIGRLELHSRLVGGFSLPNHAGAVALALGAGLGAEAIRNGVANAFVPGRLEQVETSLPFTVFVDYAHMGHALESVLSYLRGLCSGRLIVVFGAGGDRPPERRSQMGSVAARLADFSVITSDNPRSEDPLLIIGAIESAFCGAGGGNKYNGAGGAANYNGAGGAANYNGAGGAANYNGAGGAANYTVEPDRRAAIRKALAKAGPGDVVCIAGKGHETGQIVGSQKFPFVDREEAMMALRELEKGRETRG